MSVCLSFLRMIQLKNCWIHLDEISYGFLAIGVYAKIVTFDYLQSVIATNMADEQIYEVGPTLATLVIGP
jgi:hypothetical protein